VVNFFEPDLPDVQTVLLINLIGFLGGYATLNKESGRSDLKSGESGSEKRANLARKNPEFVAFTSRSESYPPTPARRARSPPVSFYLAWA
jgi:hypothetical protein